MKIKETEISRFIKDLERIRDYNDNRVLILYCNIYIEHLIKMIYKKYKGKFTFGCCDKCGRSLEPSFLNKVEELQSQGFIDDKNFHNEVIKIIFKTRNEASHELVFKDKNFIKKFTRNLLSVKENQQDSLILKALNNMNIWQNLEIAAVAIVARLYEKNEEINERNPESKLIFRINEKFLLIWPEIVSVDDPNYLI